MKLLPAAALALMAIAPTVASATAFSVNFEKAWDYGTEVRDYYNGGTALDGSAGPNVGVSFVNVAALSNDALGPYYSGAPSPLGIVYSFTSASGGAFLNVASGVTNALSFYYSSPVAVSNAVKAYSGLNGTGTLVGSIDLLANIDPSALYNVWSLASFKFLGVARSFDLTAGGTSLVAFDNIATVPEPGTVLMLLAGGTALAALRRGRTRARAGDSDLR